MGCGKCISLKFGGARDVSLFSHVLFCDRLTNKNKTILSYVNVPAARPMIDAEFTPEKESILCASLNSQIVSNSYTGWPTSN